VVGAGGSTQVIDLYPYQVKAAEFLAARDEALLADAPRVGKTPAMIRGADLVGAKNILWITNASARINHGREFKRFSKFERTIQVRTTGEKYPLPNPGVVITSYSLAAKALYDLLMSQYWDLLALDECHALMGKMSRRTEAVYGRALDRKDGLASVAERVWLASATPAPKDPAQLWPTLHAIFPERITSKTGKPMSSWSFTSKYCKGYTGIRGFIVTGAKNLDDLKRRIDPVTLRRTLKDVEPELPPMRFPEPIVLDPGPAVKQLLAAEAGPEALELRRALTRGLEELEAMETVAAEGLQARADDRKKKKKDIEDIEYPPVIRELVGLAKVEPIAELLEEEFASGGLEKIVLFCWHRSVVERLAKRLEKLNPCVLYGGLTVNARQRAQDDFRNDPARKLFIGNILAAGEAIDLSVADDILFVEFSTVPGHNLQASFRCTNSAKRRSVMVRFATLAGSVDEDMVKVVRRRTKDLAQLFV